MQRSRQLRSRTEKKKGPDLFQKDKDDFIIASFPDKGKGVLAASHIRTGEAVLEYCGIIRTEAPKESEDDTYIFECYFKGKQYWIDATFDDGSLGRLINDDVKSPNIKPKLQCINGEPHIFFYAVKDIEPMEELLYPYGGGPYPWRNNNKQKKRAASKKQKNTNVPVDGVLVLSTFRLSEDVKRAFSKAAVASRKEFTYHESFTSAVTHVIMNDDPCDRTLKYLQGLAHRCWILNKDWIFESIQNGHLLPEDNYEICGDNLSGVCYGPRKARLSSSGILEHFRICVEGTTTDSLDIHQMICAMSGTSTTIEACDLILVTKEQDNITSQDVKVLKEFAKKYGKDIVTREWLIDSLCTWTLQNIDSYTINAINVDIWEDKDSALDSVDHLDQPSNPGTDNDPLNQPSRPGTGVDPLNQPSRPGTGVDPLNQPSRPGTGVDPLNQPSRPGTGVDPLNQPSRPGTGVDPLNQPSRPGTGVDPLNQPSRPGTGVNRLNQPSSPGTDNDPSDQPSRPGTGVDPLDQPSSSGTGVDPLNQPSSPGTDGDLLNQPSSQGTDNDPLDQPSSSGLGVDPLNQPSSPETDDDPLYQPSSPETDDDPLYQPSSPETDDDPLDQPSSSGTGGDLLNQHSSLGTDEEKVDNSADSDDSEQIPVLDLKSLNGMKMPNNNRITVKTFKRNEEGKKVWDKKHYCLYCNKPFSKLPRHLETMHKNETDVVLLRSLDRRKKEHKEKRAVLIEKLRNAGNYSHNMDVLSSGQGEVVPKKSLSKAKDSEEYLPCKYCLGFYFKSDLYRHVNKCALREEKLKKGTRHQSNSAFLLPSIVSEEASQDFQKDVLADMIVDNVSLCARNDKLIILFGQKLYKKNKALTHMHQYVRTKMRELSRFLLKAREIDKDIENLSDCILAKKFNSCVKAVQLLCGIDCGKKAEIPSLALKIGHSLGKCANIIISQALVEGDVETQSEAERFLKLSGMEWNNEISATALRSLEMKKWNRPSLLPLTKDVVKLKKYLDQEIDHNMTLLNDNNMQGWRPLCETLLVSIILFNRRRSGEVEKMTLEVFNMKSKSKVLPEVMESLNSLEKQLVTNFSRVEIRGKKGRKVPVLLPQKEEEALVLLVQCRQTAGIEESNPYVFANSTSGYIRGADCMRNKASKAELENPDNMKSTNLRKHVATLSQIVDLKDNELDILAQFLGHDIKVHRNFYRLPEDTIQTAKVAKILMAVNKGTIKNFSGMSLDDIAADQEVSEESESGDDEDEEDKNNAPKKMEDDTVYMESDIELRIPQEAVAFGKRRGRGIFKRNPWSREEKNAVISELGNLLHIRKVPGKLDCERCLRNKPCLSKRNWKDIKNFMHNKIQSMKKCGHN